MGIESRQGHSATPADTFSSSDPVFLTILTRVGPDRYGFQDDLILCLEAQTRTSFEWLVLARPSAAHVGRLRDVLNASPFLRARAKILLNTTEDRSALLNRGLAEARGQYLVVVDEDDLVTHDFVEQFESAADGESILRAETVRMSTRARTRPSPHLSSEGVLSADWPRRFSLIEHIPRNQSPCLSLAFPRAPIVANRIEWMVGLEATEDWDFLMQTVSVMPVKDVPAVTSVYRVTTNGQSRSLRHAGRGSWESGEALVRARLARRSYPVDGVTLTRLVVGNPGMVRSIGLRSVWSGRSYTRLRVRVAERTAGTPFYTPLRWIHLAVKRRMRGNQTGPDPGSGR